jgi:hypothetical protein
VRGVTTGRCLSTSGGGRGRGMMLAAGRCRRRLLALGQGPATTGTRGG